MDLGWSKVDFFDLTVVWPVAANHVLLKSWSKIIILIIWVLETVFTSLSANHTFSDVNDKWAELSYETFTWKNLRKGLVLPMSRMKSCDVIWLLWRLNLVLGLWLVFLELKQRRKQWSVKNSEYYNIHIFFEYISSSSN